MADEQVPSPSSIRNGSLDLIKWLAMLTMVMDHLRYIWPEANGLYVPGRIAFPFFCLAIAANVERSRVGDVFTAGNARYLVWLLLFAALSEVPYRSYFYGTTSLNVLPTLLLGLVIAWGVHHQTREAYTMALVAAALAFVLDGPLMYGFIGALVPAALLVAIRQPGLLWLLPAALCVLMNVRDHLLSGVASYQLYPILVLATAFVAPLFGLWLLRQSTKFNVWPVRRWGYLFYPVHLVILQVVRIATL
ncbi:TraX family protein [Pseudomonas sp. D(2018)]|uniref:TraX family protein n=1 Tax=Pseudomonas sp. D(2018) TaxID=2502238 RepID=UPI001484EE60|nr:TraX family protein [Pseudomonas sp. D(2018)]